jgi:HD superfamily phosphohydrolase YqeK
LGAADSFHGPIAVYDRDEMLKILEEDMEEEEAEEYFSNNILGAYAGKLTPLYLVGIRDTKNNA